MSLAINTDRVAAVLLADGWHKARDGIVLDSYEFMDGSGEDAFCLVGGGSVEGVPSVGFLFEDDSGDVFAGPLTAILAVRML